MGIKDPLSLRYFKKYRILFIQGDDLHLNEMKE